MIYFMRHGQDDESYVGGWSDLSLIPEGKAQVLDSAEWIKDNLNIKRIVCSDINRAVESADIFSSVIGIPVEKNSNLREQNKGLLNGMPKEEACLRYDWFKNDEVTIDTVYPEGESLSNLYERISKYLDSILEYPDDTLIVTHRGVINMIYYIFNNKELDMNKKQFGVKVASVHELDKDKRIIRRIK